VNFQTKNEENAVSQVSASLSHLSTADFIASAMVEFILNLLSVQKSYEQRTIRSKKKKGLAD